MALTDRLRRNHARARAKGSPAVPYTEADVWARGHGRCYLCGRPVTREAFVIEHVLPIARGGPDVLSNVMPAHRECNAAKGARVTHLPDGPLRRALAATVAVCARLSAPPLRVPTIPLRPVIAPHVVTCRVMVAPGHVRRAAAAADEVRAAVGVPAARVFLHGAELRVELPRWPRRVVPLRTMPRQGLRFGVGVDAANRVVAADLGASPGLLVAGQSGSGKSEVLRVIVAHLAHAGASLVLVDADGDTFGPFAGAAALACAIATDTDAAHDAVAYARTLMDARPLDATQPALALVVDEAHLLDAATRDVVLDIAKRGRKRATHCVIATHRPTREVLPRVLTDQLTWAIAGRVQDAAGSRVIIGQTGAQWLAGAGDMLIAHGGHVVRMQAALGGPADWASVRQSAEAPEVAPRGHRAVDVRYIRKPDDAAVAWAVERYQAEGVPPSAKAIQAHFGGAMDSARRRRDAALAELATA